MTEINKNQESACAKNSQKRLCFFSKSKNYLKNFSPSKAFIATGCALLGVGFTLLTQNVVKAREQRDPFLNIFSEIAEMEKNMNAVFANHQKHMREIFDEAQKNSESVNKSQVSTSEDEKNYYYELTFSGFKKEEISVQVKDDILTFSGQNHVENNQNPQASSSFHYSFSAPKFDTKKEPEIIRSDNKIVVKLSKKKTKG